VLFRSLKVWFDEWELPVAASRQSAAFSPGKQETREGEAGGALPSRRYAAKIEEGLEHSHVLVLCVSANAFGSDWAQSRLPHSQPSTLNPQPAGDPLNQERRFIPLRPDDAPIKGSLAQFLCVNRMRPVIHCARWN
jgi:hypothetical protein